MKKQTRAAVYIRVSTDRQASEGESLDMQLARAREVCEANGWELLPEYVDVMSGRRDKRPSLMRLEKDLKSGAIDALICYKVDRLGRGRRKLHELLELIQGRDIRLISLTQQIDTATASGRLMLSFLIDLAVYEVEQSSERISDTLLHIARSGRPPGGSVPYGYLYEPLRRESIDGMEIRSGGNVLIKEDEAEGVRLAFDAYRRLGSLSKTAIALNKAGFRTKGGRPWEPDMVRDMITNPLYGGERALRRLRGKSGKPLGLSEALRGMKSWDLVPAGNEPIIPTEIAREVREQYWQSRDTSPRTRSAGSPWTGLIHCRQCGSKMTRSIPKTSSPVYRCKAYVLHGCDVRAIQETLLDHEGIKAISKAIDEARGLQNALETPETKRQEVPVTANRERQLANLRRKLERLEFRFDNDVIDGETYLTQRRAIIAEMESVQAGEKPVERIPIQLPESLFEIWPMLLATPEGIESARVLLRALVSRVLVDHECAVIEFNLVDRLQLPESVTVKRWPKHARHRIMRQK